jgi:hypothetical protein
MHCKAFNPRLAVHENCVSLLHRLRGVLDSRSLYVPVELRGAMQQVGSESVESSMFFQYPLHRIDATRVVPEECMLYNVKLVRHGGGVEYLSEHTSGATSAEGSYLKVNLGDCVADGVKRCITELAHRIVLWAFVGPPSKADMVAMHLCDTKSCLNPRHLFWGSVAENNKAARMGSGREKLEFYDAIRASSGRLSDEAQTPPLPRR